MKRYDHLIAFIFLILTLGFIFLCAINDSFFNRVFERHQNQWSWYIRPLFLIPFCYAALKKSLSGISITVFALFTSMAWFNQPADVSPIVKEFLAFEMQWLKSEWTTGKILLTLSVPFTFFCLAVACWKRNLWFGVGTLIMMATGKIVWSISEAGESGRSIIIPAVIGLAVCIVFAIIGFRKMK